MDLALIGVPGTGKTRKELEIIKEAIDEGKTVTYDTFRRFMARDAKDRFERMYGSVDGKVTFKTTHGLCYQLLDLKKDDKLTDEEFMEFCRRKGLKVQTRESAQVHPDNEEQPPAHFYNTDGGMLYSIYSNCVNTLTPLDKWYMMPSYLLPENIPFHLKRRLPHLLHEYDEYKQSLEKYDFCDMLYQVYESNLAPNSDLHVSDEVHDHNPLRYELLKQFYDGKESVIALDPNQRIYSFWGTNLTPLDKELSKRKQDTLSPSYRMSPQIYDFASRHLKLSGQKTPDVECKGNGFIRFLEKRKWLDLVLPDTMIVARTRHHLNRICDVLDSKGIIYRGHRGWSDKQLEVLEFLRRYRSNEPFTSTMLNHVVNMFHHQMFTQNKRKIKDMFKGHRLVKPEQFRQVTTQGLHNRLMSNNPLKYTLSGITRRFKQRVTGALFLGSRDKDVFVTTIHGSKGLEASNVLIFEGFTPRISRTMNSSREEWLNEYRVWYVAATRCLNSCFIVRDFFSENWLKGGIYA